MYLNQAILVGKIKIVNEQTVDNGIHTTIIVLHVNGNDIPLRGRNDLAIRMSGLPIGTIVGVKCRIEPSLEGINLIVEKLTFISDKEVK